MRPEKRAALEAAGFRLEDAEDFLGLTPEEARLVELRVSIAREIRRLRAAAGLSQREVAEKMKTRQPRQAKIEAAAPGVSLDQMVLSLLTVGGSVAELFLFQGTPTRAKANSRPTRAKARPKRAKVAAKG